MSAASVPEPFAFESTVVRVLVIDDDPWFVATDVAKALGYRMASDLTRMLVEDEKGTQIVRTLGGPQELTVINEPGLYRAIFGSRVEAAERFKRWLAHEVLPQIRKTGRYEADAAPPPAPALPAPDPWAVMRERLEVLETAVRAQITVTEQHKSFAAALAHLPIWSRKRNQRPGWWRDVEVRTLLVACHRQMTIDQCRMVLRELVGPDRTPSRSSMGRFFQRLDAARGGRG